MPTTLEALRSGPDCGHVIPQGLEDVLRRLRELEETAARSGFHTQGTVRLELWAARRAVERAVVDAVALIASARRWSKR